MKPLLVVALVFALCGLPQLVLAQEAQAQSPATEPDQSQSSPAKATPQTPTSAPIRPAAGEAPEGTNAQEPAALPDSPSASQAQAAPAPEKTPQFETPSQEAQPAGIAAAESAAPSGPAASKPAGSALAPGKQRMSRSFLIKMGALLGAGAAIGTVFALSASSPSRPPGAAR